uniref:Sorting nexin 13 n=1 Tax=Astyanax mexicanus TaxID=7994 RepID=A0A8B9RGC5_ASTMX
LCVFQASLSIWGWGGLGVVLFLITFGPFAIFYLAFYIFCFVGGGFAVTLLFGKTNSEKHLEKCEHSYLPPTPTGIAKTLEELKQETKQIKIDRRLTGSNIIDEPLQQVSSVYSTWVGAGPVTSWLIALFNIAIYIVKKKHCNVIFFCFLRDLCEVLLYLLLPPGDFHNKNMRYFLRVRHVQHLLVLIHCVLSQRSYSYKKPGKVIKFENSNFQAWISFRKIKIPSKFWKSHGNLVYKSLYYMQHMGGQADLFFWLTVEGYRVTAQQQLEVMQSWQKDGKKQSSQTKGLLKAAALGVYEQYLSEKASPRVQVDEASLNRLAEKLNKEDPTPEIFDDIQRKVYDMMLRDERFYPSFRQHPLYVRMLAELDMLKEPSYRGSDDGDGGQCNQHNYSETSLQLHAFISDTGVCNDHGKTYALYAITVFRKNPDGSEDTWKTYRRYSDFHDFHMRITEQFENLNSILKLPGKKTFNNMDRDFLEKRKKDLNAYLQLLLNPEMVKACPSLLPYIHDFLENKAYSKGKGDFARKMDTFVNPLRSSMRNVSNAVKSFPDSLAEGMTKMSDNMGRMSERLGQDIKQSIFKVPPMLPKSDIDPEHCRVSAQLDDNVDDNIPLRVMLLLMDEVFDLKERNQWLRRNIKNLLQQLIRATYGDTINRKIVDHVDFMTSPEQVADYVKRFRDSYWPNGILAETPPRRDKSIRMRTRVAAKTNLLGIMPDELKHIIGADTTRKGILRVFEMFQHQQLNRRLAYVFLEGFLETMFPQYKFPELFVKLHSRSPRMRAFQQKVRSLQKR